MENALGLDSEAANNLIDSVLKDSEDSKDAVDEIDDIPDAGELEDSSSSDDETYTRRKRRRVRWHHHQFLKLEIHLLTTKLKNFFV